jgi:Putative MetA-pathway of phenol degradation
MKRGIFIILALALGQTIPALALEGWSGLEDSITADRPDFTEGTGLIPPGHVQVEGGTTLARVEDVDSTTFGELLVRFGIGERSEGRIVLGSYSRIDDDFTDVSGFADPALELKIRFTEEAGELAPGQPAVALILGTSVPVGDEELTNDEWVPAAVLVFGWDLSPRFSMGANLGGSHAAGDDGDRFNQAFASLTGGFSVTDRLGTYVEWYGFSEEEMDGPSTHYVNGGISFLINDDLIVDARIGTGLNDADPDWFAGVGGAIRF